VEEIRPILIQRKKKVPKGALMDYRTCQRIEGEEDEKTII
jgi:hypothetical protein